MNKIHKIFFAVFASLLLIYVLIFTPNVPISDEWGMVPLLKSVSFDKLWQPANEHRIFFPKLIILALAHLSHWNIKWETTTSFFFLCFLLLMILNEFNSQVDFKRSKNLFYLAVLTQLSPIHHENLLWGWQLQIMLSVLMLFIAFRYIVKDDFKSLSIVIFALIVSSFSFLSGLMGWICCGIYLLMSKSRNVIYGIIYAFAMLLVFYIYFKGLYLFNNSSLNMLKDMPTKVIFFFIYLGAHFIITYKVGPLLKYVLLFSGIWGLILLIIGFFLIIKTWGYDRKMTTIPYLMVMFSILTAIISALGRTKFGMMTALMPRYHIFQMFYFFGIIWLLLLYLKKINKVEKYYRILAIIFIFIIAINWAGGITLGLVKLKRIQPVENELKTKHERISVESSKIICPDINSLRDNIKILRQMKYNIFYGENK